MRKYIITSLLLSVIFTFSCSKDENTVFKYTKPTVTASEFTDERDGNSYKCITVNGQVWMAENFRYLPMGASYFGCYSYLQLPKDLTTSSILSALKYPLVSPKIPVEIKNKIIARINVDGASSTDILKEFEKLLPIEFYNRIGANPFSKKYYDKYGALYTLEAAEKYAPEGWRLPTDEDWLKLEESFGMSKNEGVKLDQWRGEGLSKGLKSGEDGIGFNALYGGLKIHLAVGYGTPYFNEGSHAYFWTATKEKVGDIECAITRVLYNRNDAILRGTSVIEGVGNSVRYIKK